MIFAAPFRKLMVPVMIRVLRIDPKILFDSAFHYKVMEKTVDEVIEDAQDEIKRTKELENRAVAEKSHPK